MQTTVITLLIKERIETFVIINVYYHFQSVLCGHLELTVVDFEYSRCAKRISESILCCESLTSKHSIAWVGALE